jgi:hypothetical protein
VDSQRGSVANIFPEKTYEAMTWVGQDREEVAWNAV